jgi:hypothetical protein
MRISLARILISACLILTPAFAKSSIKSTTSGISPLPHTSIMANAPIKAASVQLPDAAKLFIGAGGIYAAFLYYGTLQEDVFHYVAADGSKFKAAWFLQTLGKKSIFTGFNFWKKFVVEKLPCSFEPLIFISFHDTFHDIATRPLTSASNPNLKSHRCPTSRT